jgi:hypothetical protein
VNAIDNRLYRHRNRSADIKAVELAIRFGNIGCDGIGSREDDLDRVAIEEPASATSRIEQRLELVCQSLEHHELHDSGVALERVKRSEDRRKRVRIGRSCFEHQDTLFDLLEEFFGLGTEEPHHLVVVSGRKNGDRLYVAGERSFSPGSRRLIGAGRIRRKRREF